jgi:Arc/MetJ family transcription regulator
MHSEVCMRTTIDLPETLVREAMKMSHQKTKTGMIVTALEDFVRKNRLQELKKFRGRIDLNIDLDKLRKRS